MTRHINNQSTQVIADQFDLTNIDAYQIWREKKLSAYPATAAELIVNVTDPGELTDIERQQILKICNRFNMAVYQCGNKEIDSTILRKFAANFGLHRLDHHRYTEEDGISEITISEDGPKEEFIPYTNRPIGWHTDGYYNKAEDRVYTLLLHCGQPAVTGGVNALLDHDIAYILIRDKNPEYIKALMAPDCMTIPACNIEGGKQRPTSTGPVFLIDPSSAKLHMRYTARKHNIVWKDDKLTTEARAFITEMFALEDAPIFSHTLEAGQGLICNNVLHNRTAFTDNPENRRLLYRARFLDRITDINN